VFQVKEMGAVLHNCPCIAQDVLKLFEVYWLLAQPDAEIPDPWPSKYRTTHNMDNPFHLMVNDTPSEVFFSVSAIPQNVPH
jgi:phospholipase D3/4